MDIIIILISIVITLFAQIYVTSMYGRYKKVPTKAGKTGFEVARKILDDNGLNDVYVIETPGTMSDHYDPKRRTVKLSTEVFHGSTVAANAIAAHEVGHALQYKEEYGFIKIRNILLPLANFGSKVGYIVILISFFAGMVDLLWIGIALISMMLLFQLITLPVEFDASRRAKLKLTSYQFLVSDEINSANSVLSAAAFTYVASILTALLEILRLVLIARNRD